MAVTQIKNGFNGGSDDQLLVNPDGSINVNTSGTSTVTGTVTTEQAGLNSFQTSQYTVGATSVQITPTPLANRSSVSITIITTSSAIPVYIGNSAAVTTTTGYPLYDGESLQLDLTPSDTIYAISTIAGQTVAALELA